MNVSDQRTYIESFSDMELRAEAIIKSGLENDPDIADLRRQACSFTTGHYRQILAALEHDNS